jgi:hypothetical protein
LSRLLASRTKAVRHSVTRMEKTTNTTTDTSIAIT